MFTHQQLEQVNAFRMADRRDEVAREGLLSQLPDREAGVRCRATVAVVALAMLVALGVGGGTVGPARAVGRAVAAPVVVTGIGIPPR